MESNSQQTNSKKRKSNRVFGMTLTQIIILLVIACVGLTSIGVLAGIILYNTAVFDVKPAVPISYPTSIPSPFVKLYNRDASTYLEGITEMPIDFQIDYSQDKFGEINDDSYQTQIGTFATRQFFNPLFPKNEISGVLYFIEVYNNIEESKISYNMRLQDFFQNPNPYTYNDDFDEGVYETRTSNQDTSIISIDKLIRMSNVVINITCSAIVDENVDPKDVATWSLYYETLIISEIQ